MVAMATRLAILRRGQALVLVSTSAQARRRTPTRRLVMFTRPAAAAGELARRRFVEAHTSRSHWKARIDVAFPLYTQTPPDPDLWHRIVMKVPVRERFFGPGGEGTLTCCMSCHRASSAPRQDRRCA